MVVCSHCLEEIEIHEGYQTQKKVDLFDDEELIVCGYYDDDGNFVEDEYGNEECVWCEWCEEYVPYDDAYII